MKEQLNTLLCMLAVSAQNAKARHWYVKGENFRSDHLLLDDVHNELRAGVDVVAETMITLGYEPAYSMNDFVNISPIRDVRDLTKLDVRTFIIDEYDELAAIIEYINEGCALQQFDATTESDLTTIASKLRHWLLFIKRTLE